MRCWIIMKLFSIADIAMQHDMQTMQNQRTSKLLNSTDQLF